MNIFDTHTHLNVDNFAGKEAEEIAFARELGVTKMNIVGFDAETIEKSLALSRQYDELYSTIGWHPTEAGSYTQEVEDMLVSHLHAPKVIALGEIGLDYHWMTAPKEMQERVFRRQIQLSKDLDLPFVVHTRDALDDTYEIIKNEGVGPRGGIVHSYSGSLDKILVETDAPYLAPVPKRGRENRTAYTRYVVDKIAELRSLTVGEVAQATYENALRIFNLKED